MGSYGVFLILVTFTVFNVNAQNVLDSVVESTIESPLLESATVSPINEPTETVEPIIKTDYCRRPCGRSYVPVCGSRNGVRFQMPNKCEFENTVFCELFATKANEEAAEFLLLNEGPCEKSVNSKASRRKG